MHDVVTPEQEYINDHRTMFLNLMDNKSLKCAEKSSLILNYFDVMSIVPKLRKADMFYVFYYTGFANELRDTKCANCDDSIEPLEDTKKRYQRIFDIGMYYINRDITPLLIK